MAPCGGSTARGIATAAPPAGWGAGASGGRCLRPSSVKSSVRHSRHGAGMAVNERRTDRGARVAIQLHRRLGLELRSLRRRAGLSQRRLAAEVGIDHAIVSRIEAGGDTATTLDVYARLFAVLGCRLSAKVYPEADPLRDEAQLRLIERLRALLHAAVRARTEVPLGIPGDLRAWDLELSIPGQTVTVEAETVLDGMQALERRIALKAQDGAVEVVLLLVAVSGVLGSPTVEAGRPVGVFLPRSVQQAHRAAAGGPDSRSGSSPVASGATFDERAGLLPSGRCAASSLGAAPSPSLSGTPLSGRAHPRGSGRAELLAHDLHAVHERLHLLDREGACRLGVAAVGRQPELLGSARLQQLPDA